MKQGSMSNLGILLGSLLLISACGSGGKTTNDNSVKDLEQVPEEQLFIQVVWNADLYNNDGTLISNLAGYNIYLGHTENSIDFKYNFNDAHLNQAEIGPITPGEYHLSISAYNNSGAESIISQPQRVEVQP